MTMNQAIADEAPPPIRVYRLTAEGRQAIASRVMWRSLLTRLALVAILVLVVLRSRLDPVLRADSSVIVLALCGLLYLGHRGVQRKVDALLSSYEIHLGPEAITRWQLNTPDYTLKRAEISRIERAPHALALRPSEKRLGPMLVYRGIENYDELAGTVGSWAPIQVQPRLAVWRNSLLRWTVYLSPVLSIVVAISISSISILLPLSLILLLALGWSIWALRSSPDRGARRSAWLMLVPAVALLFKLWLVLRATGE